MTRFIDVHSLVRLVDETGVPEFLAALADALRDDFLRWREFDKKARVASHSHLGVIELMPVADDGAYAFKYVNGHPHNTQVGLPTVMAFGVLAEVDTGYPVLLSELTLTTALRTAATSAMAAKALARPDSRSMALIGNGSQSEFQALAFHALLGIEEVRVFDVDPRATEKLMRHLAACTPMAVLPVHSVAEAVRGADIVTTITAFQGQATVLTPEMIEPGMHINAVGGDSPGKTELHPDVLRRARVFVEYEPQTRIEGEIQQLPPDFPVQELWRVLLGEVPGRESAEQVTMFDSVGFALEDYTALRYIRQLALERGVGRQIALVPQLDDPKDLFGLTASGRRRAVLRRAA
ncbi:ornithine cyclodeaminase [Variovorax sp. TBS-050B]|uniref:ornithine cyclodeaminase n=1 Tax=Variovorax sp. TBS-050B TaxID=2940551 RepID=UPI002476085D|nr:ornithine cyclodeaminase [Variovorax sp. TBS-050B]MDH6591461.1 ornithine cyclodeaminase [Variovorax sp. TBS-050B]